MSPRVHPRVSAPRVRGTRVAARRGHGLWVLLVAIGLLFMQGPRLFHLLLVAHATCEHGELVELAAAQTPLALDAPLDAPDDDSDQDRADASHDEGAGHDHCDALALRHLPSAIGPALGAVSLLTIEPLTAIAPHDERRPVPLLSLAPKASPPAA